MLTGKGLAEYAVSLLGSPYMYGVNGLVVTEALIQSKANQYPNMYTDGYIVKCRKLIGKVAYDCSSITDLYLGKDRSANGWLASCSEKGAISTMPDIVGLIVHKDGHMGIHVGGCYAVEARGIDYGIVKTKIDGRPWTSWGKLADLEYTEEGDTMLKQGDKGLAVTYWQKALMKRDPAALPQWGADSDFGGETEMWTNRFKAAVGLPQDGIVDAITYGHMANALMAIPSGISQAEFDAEKARTAAALGQVNSLQIALNEAEMSLADYDLRLRQEQIRNEELVTYKDRYITASTAMRGLIGQ